MRYLSWIVNQPSIPDEVYSLLNSIYSLPVNGTERYLNSRFPFTKNNAKTVMNFNDNPTYNYVVGNDPIYNINAILEKYAKGQLPRQFWYEFHKVLLLDLSKHYYIKNPHDYIECPYDGVQPQK